MIFVESSSTFFIFFDDDAYAFTSTRRNFQGIRLRRRVDVFSTTSDTILYPYRCTDGVKSGMEEVPSSLSVQRVITERKTSKSAFA